MEHSYNLFTVKVYVDPLKCTFAEIMLLEVEGKETEMIGSDILDINRARGALMDSLKKQTKLIGTPITIKDLPLYIYYKYKNGTFEKLLSGGFVCTRSRWVR